MTSTFDSMSQLMNSVPGSRPDFLTMAELLARARAARGLAIAVVAAAALFSTARADQLFFEETFSAGGSNWRASAATPLAYQASGGPDGSGYVSRTFATASLSNPSATSAILFRAQDEFGSSGGLFAGDWIASQVKRVEISVRHNAPEPIVFRGRFSSVDNFPGASPIQTAATPAGVWTTLSFAIDPASPQYFQLPGEDQFEGSNFASIFSSIGHMQFGVGIPASLRNSQTALTFDLDDVRVIAAPEPAGGLLAAAAALAVLARRRRNN